jgi:hypothetical protein
VAAAREQLKTGYELRLQGNYAEAVLHLTESLRLNPTDLKTLLNLADCEEHLGKLVDARTHWLAARDGAGRVQNEPMRAEAQHRLEGLDQRLPWLTIRLAPGAPVDTEIMRDQLVVSPRSLGEPTPVDATDHVLLARAKGYADSTTHVTLEEGQRKEITLQPGERLPENALSLPAVPIAPPHAATGTDGVLGVDRRLLGLVVGSVGIAGIAAGSAFGLMSISTWSNAKSLCGDGCAPGSRPYQEKSDALNAATASDIGFIAGGVLLAGGLWLFLSAQHSSTSSTTRATPVFARSGSGTLMWAAF